ncbi:hypothetical protein L6452_20431 [Arctium lappa]|uniref:Uncharacterized protein n=1 Tax=Arctium lappa TaxID=4217 RepID=A0ACB9BC75_ARCLA|nr:hypothetical protein L6452_20431 [Arctium lappa]
MPGDCADGIIAVSRSPAGLKLPSLTSFALGIILSNDGTLVFHIEARLGIRLSYKSYVLMDEGFNYESNGSFRSKNGAITKKLWPKQYREENQGSGRLMPRLKVAAQVAKFTGSSLNRDFQPQTSFPHNF